MNTKRTATNVTYLETTMAVAIRSLLIGAPLTLFATASIAETRGYVISWFATATYNKDFKEACPEDRNGGGLQTSIRNLMDVGYSKEEATEMANDPTKRDKDIQQKIINRARVNGKPASVYNYPDAVPDPNIETVTGKFAYGFDLGGKAENKFTDPETGQKVDNQLWRAVGCTESYRAMPPQMPYPEELSWNTMIDSAPAWVIQIHGEDLSKDGKVTVTLDKVFQHLERDAIGGIMSDATYVIDPSPRSHNVLQGEIKGGLLTVRPKDIYLEGEMPFFPEIAIKSTHMRFKLEPDGRLVGFWGGFTDWKRFVYMHTARPANGADTMGIYHAVKKMADADPDPKTGQNRYISTTYRMEAVPAYLAKPDGVIVASPATPGSASAPVATVSSNSATVVEPGADR